MPHESPNGFGTLLNSLLNLELDRRRADEPSISLTEVHKEISDRSGVSARHIIRLKQQTGFPERSTLKKLAVALPVLSAYLEPTTRSLAGWSIVEGHQDQLAKGSTITVVSGWGKPLVVMHDDDGVASSAMTPAQDAARKVADQMARRIAENIFLKRINYAFVGPAASAAKKKQPNSIGQQTHRRILRAATDLEHSGVALGSLAGIIERHVRFFEAPSGFEWHLFPRYTAFYNLFSAGAPGFRSFGMLWERGTTGLLSPAQADKNPQVPVEGWTYLTPQDFESLKTILEKRFSARADFPRPA